jgi:hypothetical protein
MVISGFEASSGHNDQKRTCPACGGYRNRSSGDGFVRCLSCSSVYALFPVPRGIDIRASQIDPGSSNRVRWQRQHLVRRGLPSDASWAPLGFLLPDRLCHVLALVPPALGAVDNQFEKAVVHVGEYHFNDDFQGREPISVYAPDLLSAASQLLNAVKLVGILNAHHSPLTAMVSFRKRLAVSGTLLVFVPKYIAAAPVSFFRLLVPGEFGLSSMKTVRAPEVGWIGFSREGLRALATSAGFRKIHVLDVSRQTAARAYLGGGSGWLSTDFWTDRVLGSRSRQLGLKVNPEGSWLALIAVK